MTTALTSHSATLLANGQLLFAGGVICSADDCSYLASAEIFNPVTRRFAAVGKMIGARDSHTATLLTDGTVLLAGGRSTDALSTVEIYNPDTGRFTAAGAMGAPRFFHTATLLADGQLLFAGGRCGAPDASISTAAKSSRQPPTPSWAPL